VSRATPLPVASELEQRCVNAIRALAMDAVQQANSGHPGLPMGAADAAYVLWSRFLTFDAERPHWPDRDRFVLSAGHGCMLQYALLHLTGYGLTLDDLRGFRQWGSRTPGHPEYGHTTGIETTTGPLGQGISTAVGMAMAERHLAARLNPPGLEIVHHRTWVIASDGDLMEGVSSEACSLAGHLGLGRLNVIYDDNHITIDGNTALAFTENVDRRFEAYGWHVQRVDGHDRAALAAAMEAARAETSRPSLICSRSHIAYGSPHKQDSEDAHGSPLGAEEVAATKRALGWPEEPAFFVPDDVRAHYTALGTRGREERTAWEARFAAYRTQHPDLAAQWDRMHAAEVTLDPEGRPTFDAGKSVATRAASGKALAWLSPQVPALWGGSADLAPSNLTLIPDEAAFSHETPAGRNLHFGVREHAMAAALNGMAVHGGIIPYGATFLIFSDYLRPSLRLAALMGLRVIYVFTHDSIFLGEDGPTHQPISQLASLRSIPGVTVIRPCDAEETVQAWEVALNRRGPVALSLTRQGLPALDRAGLGIREDLNRGAYVVLEPAGTPELMVFATGSEVAPALEAARRLNADGRAVRLAAVPSWELFAEQDAAYREHVLASRVTRRVAVEAAAPFGWERFVGLGGTVIGMNRFGASAPAKDLAEHFGFTPDALASDFQRALHGDH